LTLDARLRAEVKESESDPDEEDAEDDDEEDCFEVVFERESPVDVEVLFLLSVILRFFPEPPAAEAMVTAPPMAPPVEEDVVREERAFLDEDEDELCAGDDMKAADCSKNRGGGGGICSELAIDSITDGSIIAEFGMKAGMESAVTGLPKPEFENSNEEVAEEELDDSAERDEDRGDAMFADVPGKSLNEENRKSVLVPLSPEGGFRVEMESMPKKLNCC
jgi:hypothetical protein